MKFLIYHGAQDHHFEASKVIPNYKALLKEAGVNKDVIKDVIIVLNLGHNLSLKVAKLSLSRQKTLSFENDIISIYIHKLKLFVVLKYF
jgi:hypothetical protein